MRIAIGQIMHETNTMFGAPTPLSEFQRQGWHSGAALVERYGGSRNYLSGMLDAGGSWASRSCRPSPPTRTRQARSRQRRSRRCGRTLLDGLRAALPVDGVVLALHGAGSAEGVDDIEGAILADVRQLSAPTRRWSRRSICTAT